MNAMFQTIWQLEWTSCIKVTFFHTSRHDQVLYILPDIFVLHQGNIFPHITTRSSCIKVLLILIISMVLLTRRQIFRMGSDENMHGRYVANSYIIAELGPSKEISEFVLLTNET